jgi:hypothetical protein
LDLYLVDSYTGISKLNRRKENIMSIVPIVVIGSLAVFAVVEAFAFGFLKDQRPEGRVQPE